MNETGVNRLYINQGVSRMISADEVFEVFGDCLFKDEEVVDGKPTAEYIIANGIISSFAFHKDRLNSHKTEIEIFLDEIDHGDMYKGVSTIVMCIDKSGRQWGEQVHVEQLCALAGGLGLGKLSTRELNQVFPGGMPYFFRSR